MKGIEKGTDTKMLISGYEMSNLKRLIISMMGIGTWNEAIQIPRCWAHLSNWVNLLGFYPWSNEIMYNVRILKCKRHVGWV